MIYKLALAYLYRYRSHVAHRMLAQYGSAEAAWENVERDPYVDKAKKTEAWERALREEEFVRKHGISTCFCLDEDYPERLKHCVDRPVMLFGKGNIQHSKGKFVSVVGTRRATERGKELTRRFVLELAQVCPDVTIVSGLAYGIDVAAHRAALETDLPTIIIPAHGLDRIYPAVHRQVAVEALENGGILTEYMSGTEPDKMNFVARNRIVAGMADAVLVAESQEKGGSLITASMAIDYNRDLFAFPGRPNDMNSRGCNNLIRKQQASLINSAADLVEQMGWNDMSDTQLSFRLEENSAPENDSALLRLLRSAEEGLHINSLVMESQMPYGDVAAELTMMEMEGKVRALPGGIYRAI
ncbi:MAG: DNA-processing protein DprA [Paludibacteraceae bacterium]|nr:DNA-processing protein DprA [Paludibacteraceae bacterium]